MNTKKRREPTKIQKAFMDYINDASCQFDTAVSLTFAIDPETRKRAQTNFRWFANKLNDTIYGNNWQRRFMHRPDQRIAVVPMIENGFGTKQLHYHCAMKKPADLSDRKFEMLIVYLWSQSKLGGEHQNTVRPIYDLQGWSYYISEELTQRNIDVIDTDNMYIY